MKPSILVFIDWFLPGYKAGGPIKSVVNIISSLNEEFEFSVVTSNKDFGDKVGYESIIPNRWIDRDNYRIIYLNEQFQNFKGIRSLIYEKEYDLIYLNSLFSLKFTLLPLIIFRLFKFNGKVILAPRGMLGDGALKLKRTKKLIFLQSAKLIGIFNDVVWHASTHLEANEVRRMFGKEAKISIAKNITIKPERSIVTKIKTPHNASFFFLSRITPKKNLLGALEAIRQVDPSLNLKLDIIGPIEDEDYWNACLKLINALPQNFIVNYLGVVPNYKLGDLLKEHHFLLFPTFNENYGHVVVESWTYGCPVILSDQTPWNKLEDFNVGWNAPLNDQAKLTRIITDCILMNNEEFQSMCSQIDSFLLEHVISNEIIEQNRKLFIKL